MRDHTRFKHYFGAKAVVEGSAPFAGGADGALRKPALSLGLQL